MIFLPVSCLGAGPGGGAAAGGGEAGDEVRMGLHDRGGNGDGAGGFGAFELDGQDGEAGAVLRHAFGEDLGDHVFGGVGVVLGDGDRALGDALLRELIAHGLGDGVGVHCGVGRDLDGIVGVEALVHREVGQDDAMPLALAFSMMGLATGRPPNHMATPLVSDRETVWSARATRASMVFSSVVASSQSRPNSLQPSRKPCWVYWCTGCHAEFCTQ